MKVTNFRIEPAMFVPGDEVTISFTVKAESGDTIGPDGLYVYLAVSGSAEALCYRDSAFTIAVGKSKAVTAKTVLLSSAYSFSRGTVLSSFGVQLGQYGTRVSAGFPVTVLDARYSPAISLFRLERAAGGAADDEGESLMADVLLGKASAGIAGNMKLRLYYRSGAMPTTFSSYIDLSGKITALLSGVTDSTTLITRTFSKSSDWYFLLEFGDNYESVQAGCMVAKSFANMHLSGSSTGGVCFGGFSSASAGKPRLESHYPVYLYGGIAQVGGGWTYLTPANGSTPGTYGGGLLRCRAIENKRIIDGSMMFKPGSETIILAQLPDGYAPSCAVFSINACSGGRVARIGVGGVSEENAGKLVCSWVRNLSDGAVYTDASIWVQCSIEYWVD